MKQLFLGGVLSILSLSGQAQERIYRCGNEYTNTAPDAKAQGCKLMEGISTTVIQGPRAGASAPAKSAPAEAPTAQRIGVSEQKSRDLDARKILEAELKKAELRQLELGRAYNAGLPDKRDDEARQPQKYQERVAELKASLARGESDLSNIRRELSRMSPALTPLQVKK